MTTNTQHVETIRELARSAQVCGLAKCNILPTLVKRLIAGADAAKRPLSPEELKVVCLHCKTSEVAVEKLVAKSSSLVDEARRHLLIQEPGLVLPGGELFPEQRAEACWRDCEQFLRVVTYGVACDCPQVTDKDGIRSLMGLYRMISVPVPALLYALAQMRRLSATLLQNAGHIDASHCLCMGFDDLIDALRQSNNGDEEVESDCTTYADEGFKRSSVNTIG